MSPRLVLQFLGLPQILLDDQPIATDRRKAIALLAYLAVNSIEHSRQKYARESLSALFWPDYEQAKAFSNLRRTIWEVNQALGEGWLIAGRESVQLNQEADIDLDVARFLNLISQARQQLDPSFRVPLLRDAVKLYRNHFLTGFSLKDAYPFNEWAYIESEELRHQLADALKLLVESYCKLNQAESAIPHARRVITLDPLNESAHRQLMEVYLKAGQPDAALKQYQTCEQLLRKELNLDPQPETRALYKRIRKRETEPAQVTEQVKTITPKHNLPFQLSTFIGREKEGEEVVELLKKNRLVTLAGVGGIGKTRLALQVGQKLLNDYPDGVWFISLESLSNPTLVPQTVAFAFDIREGPDRPVAETLVNMLREKTPLLILDNCEHLLEGCAQLITSLLTHCSRVKILATSREILNIEGEATYYLPSLSIPEEGKSLDEQLTEYESFALFTERATLALSSFHLSPENITTIVNICRKLDGIPLAIELAAAGVDILNVEEILQQLHDCFALLVNGHRSRVPRHKTLKASLDWSWSLLAEGEQRFLRQLSVFAGGWTLESAQAVCEGNTLDLISALVRKSLVMVHHTTKGDTRYHFHEIVRQYVHERLSASGEEENIRTRHLKYFLGLSEKAEPALKGPAPSAWHGRLRVERDNIRAALAWADKTDVEAGMYLSGRLHRFWENFDMREGNYWLSKFLQKPESHSYPGGRSKALNVHGWLLQAMNELDDSRSVAQECLELCRTSGNREGEIDSLILLGMISGGAQNMVLTEQALTMARSLGDVWRQAFALAISSWGFSHGEQFTRLDKAIKLFRQTRDLHFLAFFLCLLGYFAVLDGKFELAQKNLDEATLLNDQLQDKTVKFHLYGSLGRMAMIRGEYKQARSYLLQELEITEEIGARINVLWGRTHLGYLALRENDINEARNIFSSALQSFQRDNSEIGVAFSLEGMAQLYVNVAKPKIAARLIGWADATREKISDTRPPLEQADVDKIIAACLAKLGEVAFSDAYDAGQSMTLEEAIACTLEEKN